MEWSAGNVTEFWRTALRNSSLPSVAVSLRTTECAYWSCFEESLCHSKSLRGKECPRTHFVPILRKNFDEEGVVTLALSSEYSLKMQNFMSYKRHFPLQSKRRSLSMRNIAHITKLWLNAKTYWWCHHLVILFEMTHFGRLGRKKWQLDISQRKYNVSPIISTINVPFD